MGRQIVVEREYFAQEVTIVISDEGARYIADVMEQHQYNDAGARRIVEAIRDELGDEA